MVFFERIRNGWNLAMECFDIVRKEKSLIVLPILSTISLLLIMGSFFGGIYAEKGFNIENLKSMHASTFYFLIFIVYLINYSIIVFFNTALVYCVQKIISGNKATVKDGLIFSFSRIGSILAWALISATVGVILKNIENKHEILGKIVRGIFGILWSLATFFVVPVMVYENLGVLEAIKRSTLLIKNTWGEQIGASFSFYLIGFIICWPFLFLAFALLYGAGSIVGFLLLVLVVLIVTCVFSTAKTVFTALAYQYATGMPVKGFDTVEFKDIFVSN